MITDRASFLCHYVNKVSIQVRCGDYSLIYMIIPLDQFGLRLSNQNQPYIFAGPKPSVKWPLGVIRDEFASQ